MGTHTCFLMRNSRFGRTVLALAVIATGAVVAGACGGDAEPTGLRGAVQEQAVSASVVGTDLVIQNSADVPVRVSVVDAWYLEHALALWCFGFDECGELVPARGSLRVPIAEITGYDPGRTAVLVHWWDPAAQSGDPGEGAPVEKLAVSLR